MKKSKEKTTVFNPPRILKKPLLKKITRNNLEKKVRRQTNELKVRNGQLRQGADREKLGADREKLGADREKLADLKIEEQREELLHVTRVGKLAEFVSSLAHEISQPLTAILSYAQAAQRMLAVGGAKGEAGREPELQEILQYIINEAL